MPNGFAPVPWEVLTTAQHFWLQERQTTDLRFWSWVMVILNNCRTLLNLACSNKCPTVLVIFSWEVHTTIQWFRSWDLGNWKNWPTFLVVRISNIGATLLFLGSSNNCPTVLVFILGKFKQLSNCFGLEPCKVEQTAEHLWSCEVQTTANGFGFEFWEVQKTAPRFWSWVLGSLNNFLILLGLRITNICLYFWSWELQTTAQLFWFWALINSSYCPTLLAVGISNNYPTVLVSNLGMFEQLPNTFAHTSGLGNVKQLPNTFGVGKFKQLPRGFCRYSWEVQTTVQRLWSRVLWIWTNC